MDGLVTLFIVILLFLKKRNIYIGIYLHFLYVLWYTVVQDWNSLS